MKYNFLFKKASLFEMMSIKNYKLFSTATENNFFNVGNFFLMKAKHDFSSNKDKKMYIFPGTCLKLVQNNDNNQVWNISGFYQDTPTNISEEKIINLNSFFNKLEEKIKEKYKDYERYDEPHPTGKVIFTLFFNNKTIQIQFFHEDKKTKITADVDFDLKKEEDYKVDLSYTDFTDIDKFIKKIM
jgi:hypothetical protein